MLTDNFPVQFRYISKRLVTDIVQQWAAGRPRIKLGSAGANVGIAQATVEVSEIDWENRYQLVKLATLAVRDHTGWIDAVDPHRRIPTGEYIRGRMYLQQSLMQIRGWGDGGKHPAAGFVGWENLPDFGRVFVGMVGSQANLDGVQSPSKLTLAGRTASDMVGLHELIDASREPSDPRPDTEFFDRERAYASTVAELLAEAAGSFEGTYMMGRSEPVDFLLQVYASSADIDLQLRDQNNESLGAFTLALIGAPIWISTPEPRADRPLPSPRQVRRRNLPQGGSQATPQMPVSVVDTGRYDQWLSIYIDVWQQRVNAGLLANWPPVDSDWNEFCGWAVAQATRFANSHIPLSMRPDGQGDGHSAERAIAGPVGWLTSPRCGPARQPIEQDAQFVLLASGEVCRRTSDGQVDPAYLEPAAGPEVELAAAAILRTVARWRTQFSPPELEDPLVDNNTGLLTWPSGGPRPWSAA